MRIDELMTRSVISVSPDDALSAARALFHTNNIHHLLVMERGRVVGVLSVRDIIGKANETTVGSVMARNVVSVRSDASTRDVASAMIGRGHGCVPVVDDGRVVGVVTTTDLLRVLNHSGALTIRPA